MVAIVVITSEAHKAVSIYWVGGAREAHSKIRRLTESHLSSVVNETTPSSSTLEWQEGFNEGPEADVKAKREGPERQRRG